VETGGVIRYYGAAAAAACAAGGDGQVRTEERCDASGFAVA
jgi:hypothetical protein